jgi:hypothetical protein
MLVKARERSSGSVNYWRNRLEVRQLSQGGQKENSHRNDARQGRKEGDGPDLCTRENLKSLLKSRGSDNCASARCPPGSRGLIRAEFSKARAGHAFERACENIRLHERSVSRLQEAISVEVDTRLLEARGSSGD